MHCTERRLTPAAFAMSCLVQCVTWLGGSEQVSARIFATVAVANFAVPGGRFVAQQGFHTCFGIPRLPATPLAAYSGLAGHLGDG